MNGSLSTYLLLGVVLSVVLSVGGLALMGFPLVRLPADYFRTSSR